MKKICSRSIWFAVALIIQAVLVPSQATPTRSPDAEDEAVVDDIGMRTELDAIQSNLVRYNLQAKIKTVEDLIPALEAADEELTKALDNSSPDQADKFDNVTRTTEEKLLKAEGRYERSRVVQQQFPVIEKDIWNRLSQYHERVLRPPSNLTTLEEPEVAQIPSAGGVGTCVETSTRTPPSLDFSSTQITTCGGVVPLRLNSNMEIRYKSYETYGNNEFCVWTFVTDSPATKYTFYKEAANFEENYDGLVYYTWNGGSSFAALKQSLTTHTVTGQHAFMAFSSDGSTTRSGFRIRVTAQRDTSFTPSTNTYSASSLQLTSSTYTYPRSVDSRSCYNNNERYSAVVQTSRKYNDERYNKTISLTSMDTEHNQDRVYVYKLFNFRNSPSHELHGIFSGQHSGTVPNSELAQATPALFLFESNSARNGRGFTINWTSY